VENCPNRYRKPHHAGLLPDLAGQTTFPGLAARLIQDGKLDPRCFAHRPDSLLAEIVHAGSPEFAAAFLPGTSRPSSKN
jgi:hypothetical protein